MATDLAVTLANRPGTLADLGEALGAAEVNIDGVCGFVVNGEGIAHVLVEDAAAARQALEGVGLAVRAERDVLLLDQGEDFVDRPGMLGELARGIAEAGVNVDLIYGTVDGRIVLGADDLDGAAAVIREMRG
jgi:hypothetical protein